MNGGTKFTIFNLLLFVFISCSNLGNDQNSIVGTWYCINYPTDICYGFTNDRVTIEFGDNFSLQGEYKIISQHDSIVFNVDSGFGSIYCNFHFVDQFLVLTAYKELEEYPNHIDEVLLLSKSNKKLIDNKELEISQLENHVFFFDDPGLYFVVSNEEDSVSYQSACNHITYTTKMISPIHFAFRKIKFVKNGPQQPNNDLSYRFWDYSIDSMDSFSNSFKNNSPEDLVAIVYGYNQLARDEINELLGTDFIGDIFMFEIDTLKNIKKENAPSHIEN